MDAQALLDAVVRHLTALNVTASVDETGGTATLDGHPFRVLRLDPERGEARSGLWEQLATMPSDGDPFLLTAPRFSDADLDHLAGLGYAAVDALGNAHLRHHGIRLDVRGRRAARVPKSPSGTPQPSPQRRQAGLAVTFVLLVDPALITASLRSVAAAAGVSLGTAQNVVKGLKESGRLTSRGFADPQDLGRRWVEDYARLLPDVHLRLNAPAGWWREVADEQRRAAGLRWGGDTAAELLRGVLRTPFGLAYAPELPHELIARFRMRAARPHLDGPDAFAEFRRPLWGPDWPAPSTRDDTVPTLLVYADLIADGDGRLREAADELRENDDALRRLLG